MGDRARDLKKLSEKAIQDTAALEELVEALSTASRRDRQNAAAALALVAKEKPELLTSYSADFADALNRPEAQTRWECLDIFTMLVDVESRICDKAITGAEAALFDEDSGLTRLAAMRFLCKLGSTTQFRSKRVWPLIDEAIQCYHGDPEFNDMLTAVTDFSNGKLDDEVKTALAERMSFDATSGKGSLKSRAAQIVENLK